MTQRPSLLDQAGISDKPASKAPAKKGGGVSAEKAKLGAAVALLLLAVLAAAWGMGAFRGGPRKTSPEQRAQLEEKYEEQLQEEKKAEAAAPERRIEAGG